MKNIFSNYEYFLAIVSLGSITKAAESLYIAQPSMTHYLKQLETAVGTQLINRDTTPLTLTQAGEIYYKYVIEYESMIERMKEEIEPFCSAIQGKLTVGIPTQLQPLFNRALILPFSKLYPSVKISLNGSNSPTLEKLTSTGQVDISILHIRNESYDNLEYTMLKPDPALMVCNKNHRLVYGKDSSIFRPIKIKPSDIRDELFYLMEPSFILRQAADDIFKRTGYAPKRQIELSNVKTSLSLCADVRDGIAFATRSSLYMFERKDKLAFMEFEDEPIMFKFVYCRPKQDISIRTRALVEFIEENPIED